MKEVLVVDDEQQMLVAVDETLKRKGYAVATASSGVEALGKLEKGYYQAVISDVRMPELNGMDLLREVKRVSPTTPVILLTGHGTVCDAVTALKRGAFDYLMKPFSALQLIEVVKKATATSPVGSSSRPCGVLTRDLQTMRLLELAAQAAQSEATILVEAESGTGKELVARYIHNCSARSQGPFVAVNCAALPEDLLESELFGYDKGAFTGAVQKKPGRFELANGGTILLDEIGEMAPLLQAKLLRVLQEREVDRVGGLAPIKVDVRVIATTNRNLKERVAEGSFREDLYYRLNVIPLTIPPLRDRKEDIPLLANHFCDKYGVATAPRRFAEETLELFRKYDWPGNVRELENVTRRALALCRNPVISPADVFMQFEAGAEKPLRLQAGISLRELEKEFIRITLMETDGNRTRAAAMLGISLRTLRNKLREYREAGDVF
ncbi:MAG: sigma-54-dependent transcriptional regulator [Acidobacteriota bacterium]